MSFDEKQIMEIKRQISENLAASLVAGSKSKQPARTVDKQELVQDICDLIRRMPLKPEEIKMLAEAVGARMTSKTCSVCGRLGIEVDGTYTYPGGDLSRPKQFVCRLCKDK